MWSAFEWLTGQMWGIPLILTIGGTGLYFTIRSGGFQFRYFGHIVTNIFKKDRRTGVEDSKKLTPFQAISIAVGGSVGVSNMSGVATAIAVGGPGALFWIWMAALLGMIIKMAEVTLAVYYRETMPDGAFRGGPTYYIEKALGFEKGFKGWKAFAILFGGGIFITYFITLQNYTVGEAVGSTFNIPYIYPSIALVVCIYAIILGGLKKVGVIASYLTPIMCVFYILSGIFIILVNIGELPNVLIMIFKGAFTTQAASGGFAGATMIAAMRLGFARSVYSNEAGWGTSPMVHATASTDHPIKQGLMGAFEVFADTICVCSITGFVVLITGQWNSGLQGAELTLTAFASVMGQGARMFVAISIFLFALTTATGWYTYYLVLLEHAFKNNKNAKFKSFIMKVYHIFNPIPGFLLLVYTVYIGASPAQIWTVADFSSALPTFINVAVLFVIGGKFIELLKDYKARYLGVGEVDPNFALFYEDEVKARNKSKKA